MKPCKIIIRQPKSDPRQRNIHNVITSEGPSEGGSLDLSPLPYPRQWLYSYGHTTLGEERTARTPHTSGFQPAAFQPKVNLDVSHPLSTKLHQQTRLLWAHPFGTHIRSYM